MWQILIYKRRNWQVLPREQAPASLKDIPWFFFWVEVGNPKLIAVGRVDEQVCRLFTVEPYGARIGGLVPLKEFPPHPEASS